MEETKDIMRGWGGVGRMREGERELERERDVLRETLHQSQLVR